MSISDAGTKVEEDSDEESELSIPVPTFSLSNEQPDGSANDTPIPATSISISVPNLTTPKLENTSTHTSSSTPERTDISIPVPILTTPQKVDTPSVPNSAPVPDISIPVPSLADRTSLPVSKPNSVPVQKPSGGTSISGVGRIVGRYVSTHPLISSTAYETAVWQSSNAIYNIMYLLFFLEVMHRFYFTNTWSSAFCYTCSWVVLHGVLHV